MSLVLRTISSAQWCMQESCGAAGLSGSISAVAVYNWVHFHADNFSLGTISFGHNHSSESKCSQSHVVIRVTGHLALHGVHKDTGQLHLNPPLIQIGHEGFSSIKFVKLWIAKCYKWSHWLSAVRETRCVVQCAKHKWTEKEGTFNLGFVIPCSGCGPVRGSKLVEVCE